MAIFLQKFIKKYLTLWIQEMAEVEIWQNFCHFMKNSRTLTIFLFHYYHKEYLGKKLFFPWNTNAIFHSNYHWNLAWILKMFRLYLTHPPINPLFTSLLSRAFILLITSSLHDQKNPIKSWNMCKSFEKPGTKKKAFWKKKLCNILQTFFFHFSIK